MQFYKNKKKLEVISGSKSHHFNKRRLAKAEKRGEWQSITDTDDIDKFIHKHHIKIFDYSGGYTSQVSKHRLQTVFSESINMRKNAKNTKAISDDLRYAIPQDDWIDGLLKILEFIIKDMPQLSAKLSSSKLHNFEKSVTNLVFHPESNSAHNKTNKAKRNIDVDVNKRTDKLYLNAFIDILFDLNINVVTHDKNGKPLKFWTFEKLDNEHPYKVITKDKNGRKLKYPHYKPVSGKNLFEVNAKWFSQRYSRKPGWSGKNIIYSLEHNNFDKIKQDERWLPIVSKSKPTIFVLWGDYGANQFKAQKYLLDRYNVKPVTSIKSMSKNTSNNTFHVSIVTHNVKKATAIYKKHLGIVVPIYIIRPVQRTVYKRLIKHGTSKAKAKKLIRFNINERNKEQENGWSVAADDKPKYIWPNHYYIIRGNKPKRMYQGIDWIMHNRTHVASDYAQYEDYGRNGDQPTTHGIMTTKGLSDVLESV